MSRPFEEVLSEHLDTLYSGALHLCAGDRDTAEDLVVETATGAASAFQDGHHEDPGAFMEETLIRTFLRRTEGQVFRSPENSLAPMNWPWAGDPAEVLGPLELLKPRVRCTLWLVVIQRRSYKKVGELLGVGREQIAEWVREGHRVLFQVEARNDRRRQSSQ